MADLVAGARSSKVISFPTDTVPALAVAANNTDEIFRLKQRDRNKPLILMATQLLELLAFVDIDHQGLAIWQETTQHYWPGALTLILPANEFGRALNPGSQTLGVRIPDCAIAIAILQQTGPLLTTSANKSNELPMRVMADIANYFPQVLVLGAAQGEFAPHLATGSGLPSTVLEWIDSGWQIKRQGQVKIPNL